MHSDLQRLEVAEQHGKYSSSAQKQHSDYTNATAMYL